MNGYWYGNGEEQEKYNEMINAGWTVTKATAAVFHSYYRYNNDGDLPGWACGKESLTRKSFECGYPRRLLNEKGIQELENRVTAAILKEYRKFKKAR